MIVVQPCLLKTLPNSAADVAALQCRSLAPPQPALAWATLCSVCARVDECIVFEKKRLRFSVITLFSDQNGVLLRRQPGAKCIVFAVGDVPAVLAVLGLCSLQASGIPTCMHHLVNMAAATSPLQAYYYVLATAAILTWEACSS